MDCSLTTNFSLYSAFLTEFYSPCSKWHKKRGLFGQKFCSFAGYIWKDQDDGIQALLRDDEMPLDKLLIETDAPFMFPFVDKVS